MQSASPGPHPDGAPHAALVTVVGLHLQHMRAAGFSVQSPEASSQQTCLSVDAEQPVAVANFQVLLQHAAADLGQRPGPLHRWEGGLLLDQGRSPGVQGKLRGEG